MMKLTRQAKETLTDVSEASKKVVSTSELATVALVAVGAVAVLALILATVALIGTRND